MSIWLTLLCTISFMPSLADNYLVLRNGKILKTVEGYVVKGSFVVFQDQNGNQVQLPKRIVDFAKTKTFVKERRLKAAKQQAEQTALEKKRLAKAKAESDIYSKMINDVEDRLTVGLNQSMVTEDEAKAQVLKNQNALLPKVSSEPGPQEPEEVAVVQQEPPAQPSLGLPAIAAPKEVSANNKQPEPERVEKKREVLAATFPAVDANEKEDGVVTAAKVEPTKVLQSNPAKPKKQMPPAVVSVAKDEPTKVLPANPARPKKQMPPVVVANKKSVETGEPIQLIEKKKGLGEKQKAEPVVAGVLASRDIPAKPIKTKPARDIPLVQTSAIMQDMIVGIWKQGESTLMISDDSMAIKIYDRGKTSMLSGGWKMNRDEMIITAIKGKVGSLFEKHRVGQPIATIVSIDKEKLTLKIRQRNFSFTK